MTAVWRGIRTAWRRLISMRTALVLLFLLALAAVPGSLLPQRNLNPTKTAAFISSHGLWGRFLDRVDAFDVFGSPWFAAIYLLLFVSLIGCIIPRVRVHSRALVRKPLAAPRNLSRLPESGTFTSARPPAEVADSVRDVLGRRWRVARRVETSGALTLSAEKGYSRETGNLLFHIALLAALILIAIGRFFVYSGSVVVTQSSPANPDQGFCNTISAYDSWSPGRLAADGKISPAPFCLYLDKFTATYLASGEPSKFNADVRVERSVDSPDTESTSIQVNHPLRLEGDRVYLISHGFTPTITVRMPDGTVRRDQQAAFLPDNATTLLSEGAFKLLQSGPLPANGTATQDIGIHGLFAPTPVDQGDGEITSASPEVNHPALSVFVYQGDVNTRGRPSNVYTLDTSKMHQIGLANLQIGQTTKLANGVTVTFDGWQPWVSFQVSHDPTQGYLLLVAVLMVVGLLGSLVVRRRRVWVRVTGGADGSPTVVSVGGLARSDSGNFTAEFAGLVRRLTDATEPAPAGPPPHDRVPAAAGRE